MSVKWTHSRNASQEYYHPAGNHRIQVVRNLGQSYWVIYDSRSRLRMVPNPYAARTQLRFQEITALPTCGEKLGSQNTTSSRQNPNYAWDTAKTAMRRVEETLL